MKTIFNIRNSFVGLISLVLFGCKDHTISKHTCTVNTPIYMSYEELRSSVKTLPGKELDNAGKIFCRGNYIFVSEPLKGIHIIDNSNPASPQNISYIALPGNIDIAVKDNMLYADSYTDLVSIDISNINDVRVVSRVNHTFQPSLPPYDERYPIMEADYSKGVIVGWKVETITYEGDNYFQYMYFGKKETANVSPEGKAGSLSRFALNNNFLHVAEKWTMKTYDISNSEAINELPNQYFRGESETIYKLENRLFVGTTTGMEIYDITSPSTPTYVSNFTHARSCDPVVAKGNFAYITLRPSTRCGGNIPSQLDVVNISNISSPVEEKIYPMHNPYGLAIDNNILYVCDDDAGLKIYNATNPAAISDNLISHISNITAHDIILHDNIMLVVGPNGLYQYSRTNPAIPQLLSTINLN